MNHEVTPEELVRRAVHETLASIGFDMREPLELQADMLYLRKIRKGSEDMSRVIRHSVLTLLATTMLYLLWDAVKNLIQR